MSFYSLRSAHMVLIGLVVGCVLVLWSLRSVPAQTPEPKAKHVYSLQYLKLPAADGEVAALAGCKSVSIAPVMHAGEAELAALCEK